MRKHLLSRQGVALAQLAGLTALATVLLGVSQSRFDHARRGAKLAEAYCELDRLTAAVESYMIDNGGYLPSGQESPLGRTTLSAADQNLLTTPVAYVPSLPRDPFRAGNSQPAFRIYAVGLTPQRTIAYSAYPHSIWMTWSQGPDGYTQAGGYRSLRTIIINEGLKPPYLGGQTPLQFGGGGSVYNGMRYDPTNGLVSVGDIYRHIEMPQ